LGFVEIQNAQLRPGSFIAAAGIAEVLEQQFISVLPAHDE
jgi:hypothetical protein